FDGIWGNMQFRSNLLIYLAVANHSGHLQFAIGKACNAFSGSSDLRSSTGLQKIFDQSACGLWGNDWVTSSCCMDCWSKECLGVVFQNEADGASVQSTSSVRFQIKTCCRNNHWRC